MSKGFTLLENTKKLVVKVGTSSLTHDNGKLNIRKAEMIVRVLSDLMNEGRQVVLVSSAAIVVGMNKMGLTERPSETTEKQAMAAVGQSTLMSMYDRFFSEYGHTTAQVLLTKDIVDNEHRYENAVNAFSTMFEHGIIPIVNENDVISTDEIEFGDNDTLSAYVAKLVGAELLVILTDTDGLFEQNPKENPDARIIPVVSSITQDVINLAGGAGKHGTGGMITKIKAAQIATESGINMIITNGDRPGELYSIFEGHQVGTLFLA